MSTDQQDGGRAGEVQGPTVPRMLVGIQLHRFREAAGVTPDQAAYEIRASRSTISRRENGLVRFKEPDVTDLLTLYGITDEQTRSTLVALTRQANTPALARPGSPSARRRAPSHPNQFQDPNALVP